MLFRLLLFLLFTFPIFAEVSYSLSRQEVAQREPLYAIIEFSGNPDIEPTKPVFSHKGVTAEYVGVEQKITSVNFNVTRKKIIKFRILTTKKGSLQTPELQILVNGKPRKFPPQTFLVNQKKYSRPPRPRSILDRFFSSDPFQERNYIEPSENDLLVFFHTSKSVMYVGEPIIGFFKVYYKNMDQPYFERNQNQTLAFPYFTSERIENVNITLEKRVTHNSLEYNTAPYQRDVYVITPLKSGSFSLGEAFFSIEGKVISYFSPVSKKVYPKRVRVLPLPKPIPKGFSGEVGKYQIFAELEKQRVAKGEGLGLTLTISGEGTGSLFQNPMKDYCLSSQPCPYTVSFLGEQKSSEFAQLSSGEYGSKSKSIFTYQLFPEKKGRIPAKAVKVIYFNPISKSYQTCQTMIPAFHVSAAMAVEEKVYQGSGKNIGYWVYALQILLVISGVVASFYYRSYLAKLLFWCLKQFDVRFYAKRPASILKVDEMIGRKKGLLLKNYLLEKGLNKAKVVELLMLKRRYENLTLLKIFQKSDNLQKDYLLKLTEELLKEEKI